MSEENEKYYLIGYVWQRSGSGEWLYANCLIKGSIIHWLVDIEDKYKNEIIRVIYSHEISKDEYETWEDHIG